MTFKKLINDKSIYIWRFLVIILLGLFGFFGSRLYAQIDKNESAIFNIATEAIMKEDIEPLQKDIRELRSEIMELNRYLRDKR